MPTAGASTVNFGAAPGSTDAQTIITGQAGIQSSSFVSAWLVPSVSADHNDDEHWADDVTVYAGTIVTGVGFTIYAKSPQGTYGAFNVQWIWV